MNAYEDAIKLIEELRTKMTPSITYDWLLFWLGVALGQLLQVLYLRFLNLI